MPRYLLLLGVFLLIIILAVFLLGNGGGEEAPLGTIKVENRMEGGERMATTKIIELIGESESGWQEAARNAPADADETLEGISGVEVKNMTATVRDGRIVEYKVNLHLAFPVREGR